MGWSSGGSGWWGGAEGWGGGEGGEGGGAILCLEAVMQKGSEITIRGISRDIAVARSTKDGDVYPRAVVIVAMRCA